MSIESMEAVVRQSYVRRLALWTLLQDFLDRTDGGDVVPLGDEGRGSAFRIAPVQGEYVRIIAQALRSDQDVLRYATIAELAVDDERAIIRVVVREYAALDTGEGDPGPSRTDRIGLWPSPPVFLA
jgi:hypothetical protein